MNFCRTPSPSLKFMSGAPGGKNIWGGRGEMELGESGV